MNQGRMHYPLKKVTLLCLLLTGSFLCIRDAIASGPNMIDFTHPNEQYLWTATNDNVMGGISTGRFIYDGQLSQFTGELSLANNGGFSSVNRRIELQSSEADTVELISIGDGRTYQLRLTTWTNGYRVNYKHDFTTVQGERLNLVFHLSDFQAVFRGRLLNDAPKLDINEVKQIGFLIADKQPLPFALNLVQIQFLTSAPKK
ncbi:CIA30 family protein [Vibrio sp. 99-70-13A1]|uniref:CIA30 family protein n=1 Tax=Vibrio sp. 99-70-13A1 TaxID=2607601 RepID=UPI001493BFF9|nr:CIA30 family protein [Vibrio sp. 99-70-13A1]NOH95787.1 CIA30 family protein [Vibrio sp. 99-70-13A1]